MIDRKKIAEKLRKIAEDCAISGSIAVNKTNAALYAAADELDPPEPKPLLADAKVGDLCQRRDGKWVQVDSYSNDRPCPVMCKSDIGGQDCFTLDGRNHNAINDSKDIIHTEPLAPEGSAEWAWQMLKLGKPVTNKLVFIAGGHINDTDSDKYHFVQMWGYSGWQLYEEKPEPEPTFKVGDWVEIDGKQYRLSGVPLCGCAYPHNQKWYVLDINGNEFTHYTSENIRKLDPSEVIVKIGCLEGTVSDAGGESFYLNKPGTNGNIYCIIENKMLDPDTAALVKALLKAQGGAE